MIDGKLRILVIIIAISNIGNGVIQYINKNEHSFLEMNGIRQEGRIRIGEYEIKVEGKEALRKTIRGVRTGKIAHFVSNEEIDYYIFMDESIVFGEKRK
jgi:hypothetical protein